MACLQLALATAALAQEPEEAPEAAPEAAPAPAPAAAPTVEAPDESPEPGTAYPPATTAPEPQPEPQPAPAPTPAAPAPEPAPAPAAAPEPVAEPEPEALPEPEAPPSVKVGMGVRTGLTVGVPSEGDTTFQLDDGLVDHINIRPYLSGQLNDYVSAVANFEIGTPNGLGTFAILDAIIQVKLAEEFQVWLGQHIPASDRSNINGPFYINGWNFPLTVPTYPFDTGARDRGVTFWGLINEGVLKYYASIVDLQPGQPIGNPRYGGRLVLHLLEPENFYYNSGTNYGAADMLAFGATVQYQDGVDVEPEMDGEEPADDNDFLGFSLDAIFEKNFGSGGTFTAEFGYWNFEGMGVDYIVNQGTIDEGIGVAPPGPGSAYMGVLSWLTPDKVGIGFIQPNARIQIGDYDGNDGEIVTLDIGLAYVIDAFNHRWHLNYRHQENPDDTSLDALQIGAQVQL